MNVRLTPLAAAILAAYAWPAQSQETAPAEAPPAPTEEAQQLPAVKVQGTAVNPYKADAVASPKFTQPLVDTPQTISVVKKEVIAEQGAMSLSDVLRNTPGITFQAGENGNTQSGDSIFMRGFDTQGNIFLDGIRDIGPAVRDVFNLEQVEIFKGPTGADNGRSAASGYINLVSKTPFADNAMSGSLSYGDEDRRRVTADLNQKIGETAAVRLNVVGQDGGVAGRDFIERQQWGVAPSIALGLGTATRFTLYSQHIRQDNTPDGGISAIGISGYRHPILDGGNSTGTVVDARPVDRENFYGLNADFENIKGDMVTARIEHDLSPDLTIRNISRYGKISQERVLTAPLQAPVASDGTGDPANIVLRPDPDTWTQGRSRQGSFRDNDILTNQTNVTAKVKTGFIEHALSGGVEFIYESQFTPAYAVATGSTQTPANLYNPDRNDPAVDVVRSGASTDGETTTAAIYLFDTLKFGERWQLNGGLRWERYETDTTNIAVGATQGTPGVATLMHDADNLLSWKVGALFKPLPNGSVYVAYSTAFRPPGGDNFTLSATVANINNPALDPQKSKNIELGTKWDFLDGKLAATAAVFKSENENDLARTDPSDPDSVIQYGKRQVEGVELGLVGQVTEAWQLSFGYTFQDTEVKEGTFFASGPSTQTGAAINFSPKNSATLWTTYKLPFRLTVGGGLRYLDSQARTVNVDLASVTSGIVEIDSYTVFDAMAAYEVTPNVGVQLNAYNLADEEYVASVNNSGHRYFPGTPRSYLLTLNLKF